MKHRMRRKALQLRSSGHSDGKRAWSVIDTPGNCKRTLVLDDMVTAQMEKVEVKGTVQQNE